MGALRLSASDLRQAQMTARASGRTVIRSLAENFGLADGDFAAELAAMSRKTMLKMADVRSLKPAFEIVSFAEGAARDCQMFHGPSNTLILAVTNPFDAATLSWAETKTDKTFSVCLVAETDLHAWQSQNEGGMRAIDTALIAPGEPQATDAIEELSLRGISEDTSPVIRLVNSTVFDALRADASDIHLETAAAGMTIRYRLDGVLHAMGGAPTLELAEQIISRIKVMSALDIAERRQPQDGRFRVRMEGREIDLRVSIMPSIYGEDAVLRILDKKSLTDQIGGLTLTSLGFDDSTASRLRTLARAPYGMFLVTGPTGSGKTTTLYAAISEINDGTEKIVTIEDPVEYQLPGVLQIPVNERKGLSFARGLRSILRHDPDKIMVGEIRDSETANIAIQSALTGHLVFTTVHANNVFDVLGRFIHMGVDPYSFVSALNGILAQRLVRLTCQHCIADDVPSDALLSDSGLTSEDRTTYRFRAGTGCGQCRGSGYRGRTTIAEILYLTDEIRELVINRASIREIKDVARGNGTVLLRESALQLVKRGDTTLSEINRVTFVA
jgi:general secretion pathway protein E